MNIPWSENPAGLNGSIYKDYTKFGSVNYLGSKEYFGYSSSSGQTTTSVVNYYNSFKEPIIVTPEEQKAIAIIHYTNQTIDLFYGEKFALQPYDPNNPQDTTGQARNFKLHIPWLMWHKNPECCLGETFYVDPANDEFEGLNLFKVQYLESTKNLDMNSPGIRYYNLWDTHVQSTGLPSRIGKVFPDSKLVVFDDDEIIAAMSYKSNRNWNLPSPQINLLAPNLCTGSVDSTGVLADSTETLYVTYRFDSSSISSLHCNYYNYIVGPTDPSQSMNVTVRFGNEFGFMSTDECNLFNATSMKILVQKVATGTKPKPESWREIDVTGELYQYTVGNGYIEPAGITGTTFVISQNDYTAATEYNLANYIDIPKINQPDLLNFGDEYYF